MSNIMTGLFKYIIRLRSWMLKVKTELYANSLFYKVCSFTLGHRNHRMHSTHTQTLEKNAIFCYRNIQHPNSQHNQVVSSNTQQHCTWLTFHAARPESFGPHLKWKNGKKWGECVHGKFQDSLRQDTNVLVKIQNR